MKTITKLIMMMFIITLTATTFGQDKEKQTATVKFKTSIECQNCVNTIMKNIPFEKGVKDVTCNLDNKTVTVVYNTSKTTPELLKRAIEKLGYTAKEVKDEVKDEVKAEGEKR